MDGCKWWYRIQEIFYVAMDLMIINGLLEPEAFHNGNQWDEQSDSVRSTVEILKCFKLAQQCSDKSRPVFKAHSMHLEIGWPNLSYGEIPISRV